MEALVPYDKGELLSTIHQVGIVEETVSFFSPIHLFLHSNCTMKIGNYQLPITACEVFIQLKFWLDLTFLHVKEYVENGTLVKAHVPLPLARLLTPMRQQVAMTQ